MKNLMKSFNFYKIKKASYIYITPNTKLSDLKYKEEIFEFFAYNSEKMNESEINEIFKKLITFKIMKNEIIDYKNFLRHFLSIDKDWMTEDIVKNSLLLYLDKLKDIKEYLEDEISPPSSIVDANFYPINYSFYAFLTKNFYKLKNENIILLFHYLQHFGNEDQKLIKNVLMMYKSNKILKSFLPEHDAEVMSLLLKMLRNKTLKINDDIKDLVNKYCIDLELKSYKPSNMHQELYYNVTKYIIELKDTNKPIEFINLSKKLEKFFLVNKINKKDVYSKYENDLQYNKLI